MHRLTPQDQIRVQFRKALRKGHVKNAELEPITPLAIQNAGVAGESFIVRVDATHGQQYWFSSIRVVEFRPECDVHELVSYDQIERVSWMFSDLRERLTKATAGEIATMKLTYFDRVVLITREREIMLDGLEQAYVPILNSFQWMLRSREP